MDVQIIMLAVTISPKYQIVIPKSIRRQMDLKPGQKMQIVQYGQRIELIPKLELKALRGVLKGIDTTVDREKEDRL
jgi:AbrB family looped-hinge helix DNA binding protein